MSRKSSAKLSNRSAQSLRGAVGLRNRIARGYTSVATDQVHEEYRGGAEVLRRFLARAAREITL